MNFFEDYDAFNTVSGEQGGANEEIPSEDKDIKQSDETIAEEGTETTQDTDNGEGEILSNVEQVTTSESDDDEKLLTNGISKEGDEDGEPDEDKDKSNVYQAPDWETAHQQLIDKYGVFEYLHKVIAPAEELWKRDKKLRDTFLKAAGGDLAAAKELFIRQYDIQVAKEYSEEQDFISKITIDPAVARVWGEENLPEQAKIEDKFTPTYRQNAFRDLSLERFDEYTQPLMSAREAIETFPTVKMVEIGGIVYRLPDDMDYTDLIYNDDYKFNGKRVVAYGENSGVAAVKTRNMAYIHGILEGEVFDGPIVSRADFSPNNIFRSNRADDTVWDVPMAIIKAADETLISMATGVLDAGLSIYTLGSYIFGDEIDAENDDIFTTLQSYKTWLNQFQISDTDYDRMTPFSLSNIVRTVAAVYFQLAVGKKAGLLGGSMFSKFGRTGKLIGARLTSMTAFGLMGASGIRDAVLGSGYTQEIASVAYFTTFAAVGAVEQLTNYMPWNITRRYAKWLAKESIVQDVAKGARFTEKEGFMVGKKAMDRMAREAVKKTEKEVGGKLAKPKHMIRLARNMAKKVNTTINNASARAMGEYGKTIYYLEHSLEESLEEVMENIIQYAWEWGLQDAAKHGYIERDTRLPDFLTPSDPEFWDKRFWPETIQSAVGGAIGGAIGGAMSRGKHGYLPYRRAEEHKLDKILQFVAQNPESELSQELLEQVNRMLKKAHDSGMLGSLKFTTKYDHKKGRYLTTAEAPDEMSQGDLMYKVARQMIQGKLVQYQALETTFGAKKLSAEDLQKYNDIAEDIRTRETSLDRYNKNFDAMASIFGVHPYVLGITPEAEFEKDTDGKEVYWKKQREKLVNSFKNFQKATNEYFNGIKDAWGKKNQKTKDGKKGNSKNYPKDGKIRPVSDEDYRKLDEQEREAEIKRLSYTMRISREQAEKLFELKVERQDIVEGKYVEADFIISRLHAEPTLEPLKNLFEKYNIDPATGFVSMLNGLSKKAETQRAQYFETEEQRKLSNEVVKLVESLSLEGTSSNEVFEKIKTLLKDKKVEALTVEDKNKILNTIYKAYLNTLKEDMEDALEEYLTPGVPWLNYAMLWMAGKSEHVLYEKDGVTKSGKKGEIVLESEDGKTLFDLVTDLYDGKDLNEILNQKFILNWKELGIRQDTHVRTLLQGLISQEMVRMQLNALRNKVLSGNLEEGVKLHIVSDETMEDMMNNKDFLRDVFEHIGLASDKYASLGEIVQHYYNSKENRPTKIYTKQTEFEKKLDELARTLKNTNEQLSESINIIPSTELPTLSELLSYDYEFDEDGNFILHDDKLFEQRFTRVIEKIKDEKTGEEKSIAHYVPEQNVSVDEKGKRTKTVDVDNSRIAWLASKMKNIGGINILEDDEGLEDMEMKLKAMKALLSLYFGYSDDMSKSSQEYYAITSHYWSVLRASMAMKEDKHSFLSSDLSNIKDVTTKFMSYYIFDPVLYHYLDNKKRRHEELTPEEKEMLMNMSVTLDDARDTYVTAHIYLQKIEELKQAYKNSKDKDIRRQAYLGNAVVFVRSYVALQELDNMIQIISDHIETEEDVKQRDALQKAHDYIYDMLGGKDISAMSDDDKEKIVNNFINILTTLSELKSSTKTAILNEMGGSKDGYILKLSLLTDAKFFFNSIKDINKNTKFIPTFYQDMAAFVAFASSQINPELQVNKDGSRSYTHGNLEDNYQDKWFAGAKANQVYVDGSQATGKTTIVAAETLKPLLAKIKAWEEVATGNKHKSSVLFISNTKDQAEKLKNEAGKFGIDGDTFSQREVYKSILAIYRDDQLTEQEKLNQIYSVLEQYDAILIDEVTYMQYETTKEAGDGDLAQLLEIFDKINKLRVNKIRHKLGVIMLGSVEQGGWREGMPTMAEFEGDYKPDYDKYGDEMTIATSTAYKGFKAPRLTETFRALTPAITRVANALYQRFAIQNKFIVELLGSEGNTSLKLGEGKDIVGKYNYVTDKDGNERAYGVRISHASEGALLDPSSEESKAEMRRLKAALDRGETVAFVFDSAEGKLSNLPSHIYEVVKDSKYSNQVVVTNLLAVQGGEYDNVFIYIPEGRIPDKVAISRTLDPKMLYMYKYLSVAVGRARRYVHMVIEDENVPLRSEMDSSVESEESLQRGMMEEWGKSRERIYSNLKGNSLITQNGKQSQTQSTTPQSTTNQQTNQPPASPSSTTPQKGVDPQAKAKSGVSEMITGIKRYLYVRRSQLSEEQVNELKAQIEEGSKLLKDNQATTKTLYEYLARSSSLLNRITSSLASQVDESGKLLFNKTEAGKAPNPVFVVIDPTKESTATMQYAKNVTPMLVELVDIAKNIRDAETKEKIIAETEELITALSSSTMNWVDINENIQRVITAITAQLSYEEDSEFIDKLTEKLVEIDRRSSIKVFDPGNAEIDINTSPDTIIASLNPAMNDVTYITAAIAITGKYDTISVKRELKQLITETQDNLNKIKDPQSPEYNQLQDKIDTLNDMIARVQSYENLHQYVGNHIKFNTSSDTNAENVVLPEDDGYTKVTINDVIKELADKGIIFAYPHYSRENNLDRGFSQLVTRLFNFTVDIYGYDQTIDKQDYIDKLQDYLHNPNAYDSYYVAYEYTIVTKDGKQKTVVQHAIVASEKGKSGKKFIVGIIPENAISELTPDTEQAKTVKQFIQTITNLVSNGDYSALNDFCPSCKMGQQDIVNRKFNKDKDIHNDIARKKATTEKLKQTDGWHIITDMKYVEFKIHSTKRHTKANPPFIKGLTPGLLFNDDISMLEAYNEETVPDTFLEEAFAGINQFSDLLTPQAIAKFNIRNYNDEYLLLYVKVGEDKKIPIAINMNTKNVLLPFEYVDKQLTFTAAFGDSSVASVTKGNVIVKSHPIIEQITKQLSTILEISDIDIDAVRKKSGTGKNGTVKHLQNKLDLIKDIKDVTGLNMSKNNMYDYIQTLPKTTYAHTHYPIGLVEKAIAETRKDSDKKLFFSKPYIILANNKFSGRTVVFYREGKEINDHDIISMLAALSTSDDKLTQYLVKKGIGMLILEPPRMTFQELLHNANSFEIPPTSSTNDNLVLATLTLAKYLHNHPRYKGFFAGSYAKLEQTITIDPVTQLLLDNLFDSLEKIRDQRLLDKFAEWIAYISADNYTGTATSEGGVIYGQHHGLIYIPQTTESEGHNRVWIDSLMESLSIIAGQDSDQVAGIIDMIFEHVSLFKTEGVTPKTLQGGIRVNSKRSETKIGPKGFNNLIAEVKDEEYVLNHFTTNVKNIGLPSLLLDITKIINATKSTVGQTRKGRKNADIKTAVETTMKDLTSNGTGGQLQTAIIGYMNGTIGVKAFDGVKGKILADLKLINRKFYKKYISQLQDSINDILKKNKLQANLEIKYGDGSTVKDIEISITPLVEGEATQQDTNTKIIKPVSQQNQAIVNLSQAHQTIEPEKIERFATGLSNIMGTKTSPERQAAFEELTEKLGEVELIECAGSEGGLRLPDLDNIIYNSIIKLVYEYRDDIFSSSEKERIISYLTKCN